MMDCKDALTEADGDYDKAMEISIRRTKTTPASAFLNVRAS